MHTSSLSPSFRSLLNRLAALPLALGLVAWSGPVKETPLQGDSPSAPLHTASSWDSTEDSPWDVRALGDQPWDVKATGEDSPWDVKATGEDSPWDVKATGEDSPWDVK